MTGDPKRKDTRKTIVILLLSANLLLLLAFFAQITRQMKVAEHVTQVMDRALAEHATKTALEQLSREHEVLLRERLQASLHREEAEAKVESLSAAMDRSKVRGDELSGELERTRAERDEHQGARIALERRLEDALTLLATLDELKARAGKLDAALVEVEDVRAEGILAATEIDRLRRQVLVLDRLVAALKARLKAQR